MSQSSLTVSKTLILILVYVCSKRLSCWNTIIISNSKTCRNTNYTEMNSKKIMQEQVLKIIQYLFLHNYNNDPTYLYWWSLLSRNSFLHHLPSTWSVVNTNLRYLGFSCTTLLGYHLVLGAGVVYVDLQTGLHMFSLSFTFIRFTFSTTVIWWMSDVWQHVTCHLVTSLSAFQQPFVILLLISSGLDPFQVVLLYWATFDTLSKYSKCLCLNFLSEIGKKNSENSTKHCFWWQPLCL